MRVSIYIVYRISGHVRNQTRDDTRRQTDSLQYES